MGRGEDEGEKAFREREREAEQEHRHEAEKDKDRPTNPAPRPFTGPPSPPGQQALPPARLAHDTPHDLSPCDGFATDGLTFVPQDLNAEGLRAATVKSERRCS